MGAVVPFLRTKEPTNSGHADELHPENLGR